MTITILEDLADEFNWNRIETSSDDNGLPIYRFTEYDDGTTRLQDYENGVLRFVEQADMGPSNARPWERIETYYDMTGQIEARFQVNDNGIEVLTQFENGVRRFFQQVDLTETGGSSDVKSWESIEIYYDINGQVEARFQHNDDGVEILTQFENGVRRSVEQLDLTDTGGPSDARSWERVETYYDTGGLVEAKFQLDDNGVETLTLYENGIRASVQQVDLTETGGPSDAKGWERIDTFYDANGMIAARNQINDDGKVIESIYENGNLAIKIIQDTDGNGNSSDLRDWDRIIIEYLENGDVQSRATEYDDGDVTAFLFEEGQRSFKFELDGDDSEDWVSRETAYDVDGSVLSVTTYDFDIFNQTPGF
ncbi:MAG: hypothetical protein AAFP16_02785 [Pseudomonadota bacterium]